VWVAVNSVGARQRKTKGEKKMKQAFTLIELLVVVLIIGILTAVALPQYMRAVEKTRAMQALAVVKTIGDAQEIYYMANGVYADNLDDLGIDVPGESYTYNGLQRKKYDVFDFGAKPTASSSIAISNRWISADKVGDGKGSAYYALYRFPKDDNIYCYPQTLGDIYKVCSTLSGGKRSVVNGVSYYVIN
jgi:prepilin-type N-terminal cleavage/methylation domain-containing protein